jgi:hypothetical protein
VIRTGALLGLLLAVPGACARSVDVVQPLDCAAGSANPACAPGGWPITDHGSNSDPWLISHHDVITGMSPRVLVLNFDDGATSDQALQTAQAEAAAIGEGSRPHAYADSSAPPFLQYQILKVVDLTDHPPPAGWTNPSSTMLPTTSTGDFDPTALFTSRFVNAYGFQDSSGRALSLCDLFEGGQINEVWIEDGEAGQRRAPLNVERKQAYDATGAPIAGMFLPDVGGGGSLDQIACDVTVRMAHLDPARGPGCDLEVRGWGIEGMWDALPADAADAHAFLNADFLGRFGVQFNSFADICDEAGDACVSYPSDRAATGSYADGTTWAIQPFLQGCGSSRFPPNARSRGDWSNAAEVQARCAGFGLGGAAGGGDAYQAYSAATVTAEDNAVPDCGGGWQVYWRQSMPGPNTQARGAGGQPIKNWWPFLFY